MPFDAHEELKLFKQIIQLECGDHHLPKHLKRIPLRIVNFSAQHFPPLDRPRLKSIFGRGGVVLNLLAEPDERFIYLKPILENIWLVPVMTFKYDISQYPVKMSIRVALFLEYGDGIKSIGYRFETGDGKHAYCHVQHITEFDSRHILQTEAWIPQKFPAFPLEAGGIVGLLLCLLGSLYGKDHISELNKMGVDLKKISHCIASTQPQFFDKLPPA